MRRLIGVLLSVALALSLLTPALGLISPASAVLTGKFSNAEERQSPAPSPAAGEAEQAQVTEPTPLMIAVTVVGVVALTIAAGMVFYVNKKKWI